MAESCSAICFTMKVFLLLVTAGCLRVAPKCTTTENPPPGTIIKPPPTDIVTVQGESLQISCLALAAVSDNLYNFWNITLHSSVINVHDNSSDLYHINVYQTDAINCTLNNKLIINNVSQELHEAVLTCIEGIKVRGIGHIVTLSASNATLGVYGYPKVLNISMWPSNIGIKAGDNVTLQCQLKAAPLMYTEVEWLQNGSLVNKMKHHEVEKGGHILSILNITDFTQKDGGNYTCKCHYDRNKVTTKNDIVSNQMSVVIYAEADGNNGKHDQKLLIIVAGVLGTLGVLGVLGIATFLTSLATCNVVLYISKKWRNQTGRSANHNDDEEYIPVTRSTQVVDGAPLTVSAHQESNINATPLCTPNERTGLLDHESLRLESNQT